MRRNVLRTMAATGAVVFAFALAACSNGAAPESDGGGSGTEASDITVGVAMPTETSERWIADGDAVKSQLEEFSKRFPGMTIADGYAVMSQLE